MKDKNDTLDLIIQDDKTKKTKRDALSYSSNFKYIIKIRMWTLFHDIYATNSLKRKDRKLKSKEDLHKCG